MKNARLFPPLIGLAGFKRSGKDTLAAQFVNRNLYRRMAFADKIREECARLYPHFPMALTDDDKDTPVPGQNGQTTRDLLITHGRARRQQFPSYWICQLAVDYFAAASKGDRVIISDVRLPDEIDWIHRHGGIVIWVSRPGVHGGKDVTEQNIGYLCDYKVDNDRPLEEIDATFNELAARILTEPRMPPVRHYAIVGRIPDAQNQVILVEARSDQEAVETATHRIYREAAAVHEEATAEQLKQLAIANHGDAFFMDAFLSSSQPIECS